LTNDEIGLKITPQEEAKLNSLPLQEVESYRNQLVKNRFNRLENQLEKLTKNTHTQRERETKILF